LGRGHWKTRHEKSVQRPSHDGRLYFVPFDGTHRSHYDGELKSLIKDLANECRSFMNYTDRFHAQYWSELEGMRNRVGVIVLRLREDYGCKVRKHLNRIIP
jgi:hypothetical protein